MVGEYAKAPHVPSALAEGASTVALTAPNAAIPATAAIPFTLSLFYPGKMHRVASESEGGKTWLALGAVFDEIKAGNHCLCIDFEDDEDGIVGRLLTLALPPEAIREHFHASRLTLSDKTPHKLLNPSRGDECDSRDP